MPFGERGKTKKPSEKYGWDSDTGVYRSSAVHNRSVVKDGVVCSLYSGVDVQNSALHRQLKIEISTTGMMTVIQGKCQMKVNV